MRDAIGGYSHWDRERARRRIRAPLSSFRRPTGAAAGAGTTRNSENQEREQRGQQQDPSSANQGQGEKQQPAKSDARAPAGTAKPARRTRGRFSMLRNTLHLLRDKQRAEGQQTDHHEKNAKPQRARKAKTRSPRGVAFVSSEGR